MSASKNISFYQFLITSGNPPDPKMVEFIQMVTNDDKFPKTDNINKLNRYLYLKLDDDMTLAYQKCLMFWKVIQNGGVQPQGQHHLEEINEIIQMQNNDPNYPWPRQIHKDRFGIG